MVFSAGKTFGALLLGGFCAATLSGAVILQTCIYFRFFSRDHARIKTTVAAVCTIDMAHSLLVYAAIWSYLITNYGNEASLETIPIPLALTGLFAAVLTFIVHCFFSYRIFNLSRERWHFTVLILVFAFFRLCCATVTTAEMIHIRALTTFKAKFQWILTLGLAMSSLVDIMITVIMTYLLQNLRNEMDVPKRFDHIIGAVVLYTFETNLLTSVTSILSMTCWLTMPHNLVWLGLHFFIGKLYANSLLATLNARKQLQRSQYSTSVDLPSMFTRSSSPRCRASKFLSQDETSTATKLEITVARTVEFGIDEPPPPQCVKSPVRSQFG